MPSAGKTVSAASTNHMAFTGDQLSRLKVIDVRTHRHDFADELMANRHRDRNGLLRPFVPVVDVNIRTADSGPENTDKDVIDSDFRFGNILEPETGLRVRFNECLHFRDGKPI